MNHSFAAKPDCPRANPKWRPKAPRSANEAIDHSPALYTKTTELLTVTPVTEQTGSRKTPVKCSNHLLCKYNCSPRC